MTCAIFSIPLIPRFFHTQSIVFAKTLYIWTAPVSIWGEKFIPKWNKRQYYISKHFSVYLFYLYYVGFLHCNNRKILMSHICFSRSLQPPLCWFRKHEIFLSLSVLQSCSYRCLFSLKAVAMLNNPLRAFFILLQNTGIPLDVAARLQINMLLQENSYFA